MRNFIYHQISASRASKLTHKQKLKTFMELNVATYMVENQVLKKWKTQWKSLNQRNLRKNRQLLINYTTAGNADVHISPGSVTKNPINRETENGWRKQGKTTGQKIKPKIETSKQRQ